MGPLETSLTVSWILATEYGTSVATIMPRTFMRAGATRRQGQEELRLASMHESISGGQTAPLPPWAPGDATQAHRPIPLGKDELLREMDAAGVNLVVVVPPS